jgi:phosphoribosylglycinamide formyltransferase-1
MESYQIIIFASGSGSNAENIIKYFSKKPFKINWLILANNSNAGVIERAKKLKIDYKAFSKEDLYKNSFLKYIVSINPDLIILAGFLLKLPDTIINSYNKRVINIHPALLPKYGGEGMYGMHVHRAIIKNKESISGITIHYVTSNYDEGPIIFQKKIDIDSSDTAKDLANKIHILEMDYFPEVIEKILIK